MAQAQASPMWLQPPQGLPLPSPMLLQWEDPRLDLPTAEQQTDLANKAHQLEALQNYLLSLQRAVQVEREKVTQEAPSWEQPASCEQSAQLRSEAQAASPQLAALSDNMAQAEDFATKIHQWFASEGPKIKGYQESTDPSVVLVQDIRGIRQQVDLLGSRWQQLQVLLGKEASLSESGRAPSKEVGRARLQASGCRQVEVDRKERLAPQTRSAEVCPSGHALVALTTQQDGVTCRICGVMHARGSMMVRCDLCNFDACTGCVKARRRMRVCSPWRAVRRQFWCLRASRPPLRQNISEWPAIPEDEVQEAAEPSPSASGPEVGGWDPASPKLENLPGLPAHNWPRRPSQAMHRLVESELKDLGALQVTRCGQAELFRFELRVVGGGRRAPSSGNIFIDLATANAKQIQPSFVFVCRLRSPEKLYLLVLRQKAEELQWPADQEEAQEHLARLVAEGDWARALAAFRSFGQEAPSSFRVSGKRAGRRAAHLSSNGIAEFVGEAVAEAMGWRVDLHDYDVEVVVHLNDDHLIVGLPLLERAAQQAQFALPGLSQPVAWAMARTIEPALGELVVDPMCGSGIVLLEAAQCWRGAFYLGFEEDPRQLERCRQNRSLVSPDAARSPKAYAEVLRSDGRVVLLTNQALEGWQVDCRRKVLLGHMEALLFLARPSGSGAIAEAEVRRAASHAHDCMRLPWEDASGRRQRMPRWSAMKASLRQPMRLVNGKKCRREKCAPGPGCALLA
ncbi:unnamed protein product [Effrenium voratum]|nr:unnamed protein product [Effrenium voratum]